MSTDKRRPTVRPILCAVLVCAVLVPALGGIARASGVAPSASMMRRLERNASALLVPGVRGAVVSPQTLARSLKASGRGRSSYAWIPIHLADSPYFNLVAVAQSSEAGARLTFFISRTTRGHHAFSAQEYSWSAALPSSDIRFGKDLRSISIHTGSDLGAFGSVDLRMTSLRGRKQHTGVCRKTGKKLWTDTQGNAQLQGSLDFRPGVSVLPPKIESNSLVALAFSESSTGNHCPGHHPGHPSCSSSASFQASDDRGDSVEASQFGDTEFLGTARTAVVGRVHLLALAQVLGRSGSSLLAHGTIHLVPPEGQQLIEGSLTFLPSDWGGVGEGPHCITKITGYDGYGGTLTTALDSGPLTMHGSLMTGRYVRTHRRG